VASRIEPQEVKLDLRIQPLGKPGKALVLTDEIERLRPADRLQINAQVPQRAYLYVLWYQPNGKVELLDENALALSRIAVQEPPVDERTPWESLSTAAAGKNLVIAFTKPTPLTAAEAETLKQAKWGSDGDWLGDRTMFRTGHPRTTEGPTRGGAAPTAPTSNTDRYLGQLGALLKYEWGCYYQAVIFRVN
jgi:hypothetical protein